MSLCPPRTEADVVGEGGGCGSSSSPSPPSLPSCPLPALLDCSLLTLPRREPGASGAAREESADRLLELVDCASVLSTLVVDSPLNPEVDARGLSEDLPPGIFVRRAVLNDREDSFVSDLLNEGYESSDGPEPVGVCEPVLLPSLPSTEYQCPTVRQSNVSHVHRLARSCPSFDLGRVPLGQRNTHSRRAG